MVPNEAELATPLPADCAQRYEVVRLLGRGASGVVWLARHRELGSEAAVKVLAWHADAEERERFVEEARVTARLAHPHIIRVLDCGGPAGGGGAWIAYEHLPGRSLRELLAAGRLPVGRAVAIARQIAEALETAHGAGVLHRDVKPENVLESAGGAFKVADFGIAKWAGSRVATQTGVVLGTPHYMAPELGRGEPASPAADLYALGAVLFEMVTGQVPLTHQNPLLMLERRVVEPAPLLRALDPSVPRALEQLVDRMLSRHPPERPGGGALLAELARIAHELGEEAGEASGGEGRPARARRRGARPDGAAERARFPLAPVLVALGTALAVGLAQRPGAAPRTSPATAVASGGPGAAGSSAPDAAARPAWRAVPVPPRGLALELPPAAQERRLELRGPAGAPIPVIVPAGETHVRTGGLEPGGTYTLALPGREPLRVTMPHHLAVRVTAWPGETRAWLNLRAESPVPAGAPARIALKVRHAATARLVASRELSLLHRARVELAELRPETDYQVNLSSSSSDTYLWPAAARFRTAAAGRIARDRRDLASIADPVLGLSVAKGAAALGDPALLLGLAEAVEAHGIADALFLREVADMMGRTGEPAALPALERMLRRAPDARTCADIWLAMADTGHPRAFPLLLADARARGLAGMAAGELPRAGAAEVAWAAAFAEALEIASPVEARAWLLRVARADPVTEFELAVLAAGTARARDAELPLAAARRGPERPAPPPDALASGLVRAGTPACHAALEDVLAGMSASLPGSVVRRTVELAGRSGHEGLSATLERFLAPAWGLSVRVAAAHALGQLGNRRAVGALRGALLAPQPLLARRAALALGRLRAAEAVPDLARALEAGDRSWGCIPRALGLIGTPEARQLLRRVARRTPELPEQRVDRADALRALGRLGEAAGLPETDAREARAHPAGVAVTLEAGGGPEDSGVDVCAGDSVELAEPGGQGGLLVTTRAGDVAFPVPRLPLTTVVEVDGRLWLERPPEELEAHGARTVWVRRK